MALGLIESGNSKIRPSRATTLSFSLLRDLASFLSGKNDVPHPDPQRCLFVLVDFLAAASSVFNVVGQRSVLTIPPRWTRRTGN